MPTNDDLRKLKADITAGLFDLEALKLIACQTLDRLEDAQEEAAKLNKRLIDIGIAREDAANRIGRLRNDLGDIITRLYQ